MRYMGLWRALFGGDQPSARMVAPRPTGRFSINIPPEMLEAMTAGGTIAPRISREEALQVPAVLRSRNLIAGTLASLPHVVHAPDRAEVLSTYLLGGNIDPDIPNSVVYAQTYEDLLFEGISWWRVTKFGFHGFPVEARHVPVEFVNVVPTGTLRPSERLISPDQPFPVDGQVFIDGIPVDDREVIRFDSPNPPLLQHAARAIRRALLLGQAAEVYADGGRPLDYFSPAEGADPVDDEEVEGILGKWLAARRRRSTAYVPAALKYNTVDAPTPADLQLAEIARDAILDIARAAGIDPEDLGISTTTRTYQNGEQRKQDLLDFTLGAYVSAMQDRLSMRDILPRGYVARVKFAGFLRSDTLTRMQTYQLGREVGAYDDQRIADLEDIPLSTVKSAMRQQREAQPAPAAPAEQAPQMARFEADAESTKVSFVDFPDVAFRVNMDRRTVSGLAVPWGKVARSGGRKWRFAQGSLHWADDGRIKLNRDHDHSQVLGRAVRLQSTSQGLDSTFRVARGDEGDRALSLAEDGVLDGFSVEIDFDDEAGDSYEPDPSDRSVMLVHRATLRGVALTAMPAFDDARLNAVAASRDQIGVHHGADQDGGQQAGEPAAGGRGRVRVLVRGLHHKAG